MKTEKIQNWLNSYSVKMIIVTALALFLLIPTIWIQKIINERIQLRDHVEYELTNQWGANQTISGPVLNIPVTCLQPKKDETGYIEYKTVAHFLPEELQYNTTIDPEIRYRGIYKMPVYKSHISIKGFFTRPDFKLLETEPTQIFWDEAYFTMGITDLRGINDSVKQQFGSMQTKVEPGVQDNNLFSSGITIKADTMELNRNIPFEIELSLNGSETLMVEALGKTTNAAMQSNWSDPSFAGSFLPSKRKVTKDGFSAQWTVTHLNRNFPQQWMGNKFNTKDSKLGVALIIPVDHYQKSTRSVKYAILFIALNFIVFLFIEIRNKKRIHPFQYSLVAFALLLFYTLLTSISEQIGFNAAFAISALAITALISWYARSIMQSTKPVLWITLLQLGLYLFLFTILQLQDYALLMGSIGLFVILGIIMKASQKIKWYGDQQD